MRVPASYVPEPLYLVRTSLGRTAPPRTVAPQAKQCAPLAANSSASELLRRLRAEYSTAEVVSSFDAESPSGGPFRKACTGLTLPLAQALALTLTLTLTLTLAGLLVELHPR